MKKIYFKAILLGIGADILLSLVATFLIGMFVSFTGIYEFIFSIIIGLIAVLVGAYVTSRNVLNHKFLHGLIYGVCLVVLSFVLLPFLPPHPGWFTTLGIVPIIPVALLGVYIQLSVKK